MKKLFLSLGATLLCCSASLIAERFLNATMGTIRVEIMDSARNEVMTFVLNPMQDLLVDLSHQKRGIIVMCNEIEARCGCGKPKPKPAADQPELTVDSKCGCGKPKPKSGMMRVGQEMMMDAKDMDQNNEFLIMSSADALLVKMMNR